jgi:arabinofuranosyltransferase
MGSKSRLDKLDGLLLIGLVLLSLLPSLRYDFSVHPEEDAAILLRYSQHLAEGHGIVWNVGEKPVDGATDFLFMVLLAGLARIGLPLEIAARSVGIICHFLTVILIYVAVRLLHGSPRWMAATSSAALAVGPAMGYIAGCFGTTFFALFAFITWCLAVKLARGDASRLTPALFAMAGLATGMIRPEGVFLAGLMLLAVVWMKGPKAAGRITAWFAGVFLVLGGAYFLWRWSYFGYPLPNPYYTKGGGRLHWYSLKAAIRNVITLSLPFAWIPFVSFGFRELRRQTVFVLVPLIGFTGLWVALSNEMNYLMRFQYPLLPVILISWPPLLTGLLENRKRAKPSLRRVIFCALILFASACVLVRQREFSSVRFGRIGNYDMAMMLREYRDKGYTMAVSEAGHLPFYSGWRAIDTWGLNDQWIAHHGRIADSYLDRTKPEIIMFYAYFSPLAPPRGERGRFHDMTMVLKRYAEKHGYILAAVFGDTPTETHYYYVRRDFPDGADIVRKIRRMDYFWWSNGAKCTNYALVRRSVSR